MTDFSNQAMRQSGYLREGFADHYDAFRPAPPPVLLDALTRYTGGQPLRRVIDLGSGTGLSTRVWADRAAEIVGVEPNAEMRRVAEAATVAAGVRYVEAFAHDTRLTGGVADLVTCSQSFHWMERGPVLAEAARLLRPGGVFAAHDYDRVPLVEPEVDEVFEDHLRLRARYRDEHSVDAGWTRSPKASHLEAIRESGLFRFTREFVLHEEREVGAEEVIGFVRSLGLVPELIALGVSEEELGLTRLEEVTRAVLGDRRVQCLVGYRVRLGAR